MQHDYSQIGGLDVVVLLAYLAATVALGLWVGRGQRNLDGYLLGGRNLPWWAILGSIVATETSTATFLSVPGIAFAKETGDMRFLQLSLGYVVGRTIIVFLLLPQFFRGQLCTAYEVLHQRFGGATQRTASLVFLVTRNLGDGLRLFLTAMALHVATGWTLPGCVFIIGVATIVYTMMGGMKSVVWNDCIQLLVYMAGGIVVALVLLDRFPGGWSQFLEFGLAQDKFRVFDFAWPWQTPDGFPWDDPYTFWAGLVGGAFLTLGTHGTDQMMVQRYLAARSERGAGIALLFSGFVVMLQFALFLMLGVGLACFYEEVQPNVVINRNDEALATFVVHELPRNVGLVGLLLAAIFAAAMSTLSSSLNSSASAVVHDFLKHHDGDGRHELRLLNWSRGLTVLFGVIQIAIALLAVRVSRSVVGEALAIAGFSAGLLLGLFLLGVCTRRVDQRAALVGLMVGLTGLLFFKFASPLVVFIVGPEFGWNVAWPWLPVIGSGMTFGGGVLASYVVPGKRESSQHEN
ncbi:MAG TPA: sodium:solute symporter [Pirellulaceae bacterium]|nr:sodium:solute symporter [Pirellulaceae bacterium]